MKQTPISHNHTTDEQVPLLTVEQMQEKLAARGYLYGYDAASCALVGYKIGRTEVVPAVTREKLLKALGEPVHYGYYPDEIIAALERLGVKVQP